MKYRTLLAFVVLAFICCTNGESYNQITDSGNMLNDTLPSHHMPPVAIPLDSMPADGTDVDSMNNMSR